MLLLGLLALLGVDRGLAQDGPGTGTASIADTVDVALAAQAWLEQEALPTLEARRLRAELREQAAQDYFAGSTSGAGGWQRAFPELVGSGLGRRAMVRSRIAGLVEARARRAEERVASPPEELTQAAPELVARWRRALVDACDLEDAADLLEERFLAAIDHTLVQAPGLADEVVSLTVERWWRSVPAEAPASGGSGPATAAESPPLGPQGDDPTVDQPVEPEAEESGRVDEPPPPIEPTRSPRAAAVSEAQHLLLAMRQAAWRSATVPGDTTLFEQVSDDVAWLEGPEVADPGLDDLARFRQSAVRDRLRRVLPLLPEDLAVRTRTVAVDTRRIELESHRDELRKAVEALEGAPPTVTDPEALRDLREQLRDEAESLGESPQVAPGDPLGHLLREIHGLERTRIDRELQWVESRLELADAKAKAASADQGAAEGTLEDAILQVRQVKVGVLEREEAERGPPLPELEPRVGEESTDAYFERLCRFVGPDPEADARGRGTVTVRRWIQERHGTLVEWRRDHRQRRAWLQELSRGFDVTASPQWLEAVADLERVLATREERQLDRLDAGFERLAELKNLRRRLRGEASADQRDRLRDRLALELETELQEAPIQLELRKRRLTQVFDRVSSDSRRISWWLQQVMVGLALLALIGLWWLARTSAQRALAVALGFFESGRQERRRRSETTDLDRWTLEGGLVTLAEPAAPMVVGLLDIALVVVLLALFVASLPLIGLLGFLVLILLAGRVVLQWIELSVVTPEEHRPGLMVVTALGKRQLLSSLRWAWAGTVVLLTARYLALRVFDADAMSLLIHGVGLLLLALFGLWMLARWQGALRWRASLLAGDRMAPWVAATDVGWLGKLLRSAVAALYLLGKSPLRLLGNWFGHYSTFAWLKEVMDRQDLDEAEQVRLALDDYRRQAVLAAEAPQVDRPLAAAELLSGFDGWRQDCRRGLVLVLGDRGMGKSHFLDRAPEYLASRLEEEPGLEIARWRLHRRLTGDGEALMWLGACLGIEIAESDAEDPADLKERILQHLVERPPTVFLIDDLQYLLLRTVGGFEALQVVLAVMLASAERHFWLVSMHEPAWTYLRGLSIDIAEEMFRTEIRLQPWTAEQLREWLEARTKKAGYTPVYDRLLRRGSLRRETAGPALQRATAAYWSLLAEKSQGNPQIATVHWLDSLCRGRSERRLAVILFEPPPVEELKSLDEDELFVLTALTIHGRLTIDELARVLNLSQTTIKVACRHLLGLGILERSGDRGFVTCPHWRMSTRQFLRQSHFLFVA